MRCFFLFLLLLFCVPAFAQTSPFPNLNQNIEHKSIAEFIPPGWFILTKAEDDLNKDKTPDAVLVLQSADTVPVKHRLLIVLFKNVNGYRYIGQTPATYMAANNQADLFQSVTVKKGIIEVSLKQPKTVDSLLEVTCTYKFRWQKNAFILIGAELYHLKAGNKYTRYSYNFITQMRERSKGTVNNENDWSAVTQQFYPDYPPQTLFSIRQSFTWEIEDDVFL